MELIKIKYHKGQKAVSAKELYLYLGYDKSQWSRWSAKNIARNQFAINHEDYERLDIMSNGNKTHDFALSIDFAKRLSMMAKTEKGEIARKYFIECENKLNKSLSLPDFSNPAIAARAWAEQYEQKMIAEARLKDQSPKVQFAESILETNTCISVANMAKMLGFGQNRLFMALREYKILMTGGSRHNIPYQRYIDAGYFEVTERSWKSESSDGITFVTKVTPKGQQYLSNKFGK